MLVLRQNPLNLIKVSLHNADLPSSSGYGQPRQKESQSLGDHLIWGDDSSSTDHMSDTVSEDSQLIKRLKPRFHF